MVFAFLLGKYPDTHFIRFVTIIVTIHVSIRVVYNYQKRWIFFMTDFCYFANMALFFFLYVSPKNETLFKMVYMQANGPIAVAIFLFRCTFAIHKPDMITGVLVHVSPFIITNLIRWHFIPDEAHLPED